MSSRYFCHHCQQSVGLRDTDMICGLCGSDFIEQLPVGGHSFRPALRPQAGDHSGNVPRAQVIRSVMQNMGLNSGIPPALRRRATPPPASPSSRAPRIESLAEEPQQGGGIMDRLQSFRSRVGMVLNRTPSTDNNAQQGASGTNQGGQEQAHGDQNNQNNQGGPNDPEQHMHFEDFLRLLNNMVNGAAGGGGGVHIQFHIGDGGGERLHANLGDYAMGASMDRIISDLMNQFEQVHNQQLSTEQLARIPMTTVNQKHVDNQTQCSTCFETFLLDEAVAQLNCEHIFHRDCVEPWLRQHPTCPMCRTNVDASEWPAHPTTGSNAPPGAPAGMVDPDELD